MSLLPNERSAVLEWMQFHVNHKGKRCLVWPFSVNWNGYGHLRPPGLGKTVYAHRYMCELVHGPAPTETHQASHSCGNGRGGCVNPKHLGWKTPSDNMMDRRAHGTSKRTKRWSQRTSLNQDQVAEIKALKGKMNQREIAEKFGISYQHVSFVQQGKLLTAKVVSR